MEMTPIREQMLHQSGLNNAFKWLFLHVGSKLQAKIRTDDIQTNLTLVLFSTSSVVSQALFWTFGLKYISKIHFSVVTL